MTNEYNEKMAPETLSSYCYYRPMWLDLKIGCVTFITEYSMIKHFILAKIPGRSFWMFNRHLPVLCAVQQMRSLRFV